MANIPKKVKERLVNGLKRFHPIISSARTRDINEADTVTIVKDILSELFGYDKYTEITSEHAIRGTYCDLAVEIEGSLRLLIEVKAVGLDLKDSHARQAIDYAANAGCEWVALTNGINWKVFRISFKKPIDKELVLELDFLQLNPRSTESIEDLYLLTRDGRSKSALKDYHTLKQAASRYSIGAILLSKPILNVVRRELKGLVPGVKIQIDDIKNVIMHEVMNNPAASREVSPVRA